MRPHRRQPTRLPRPWDSPGKNTGVGCHFLLQCMKVKSRCHVRLLAMPWTAAYQAPLSMGFSRQEYRSGVPLPSPLTGPAKRPERCVRRRTLSLRCTSMGSSKSHLRAPSGCSSTDKDSSFSSWLSGCHLKDSLLEPRCPSRWFIWAGFKTAPLSSTQPPLLCRKYSCFLCPDKHWSGGKFHRALLLLWEQLARCSSLLVGFLTGFRPQSSVSSN